MAKTFLYNNHVKLGAKMVDFAGWDMGFITSNENFETCIGKKAHSVKNLKSGNLDTKFYIYAEKE